MSWAGNCHRHRPRNRRWLLCRSRRLSRRQSNPLFQPKQDFCTEKSFSMTTTAMQIDPKHVKTLREKTGAGMMDCKQALQEASGDMTEAEKILRKKGKADAQ